MPAGHLDTATCKCSFSKYVFSDDVITMDEMIDILKKELV